MTSKATQITLLLFATCTIGCDRQSGDTPIDATQSALPGAQPSMRVLDPIVDTPRLTEESLQAIENRYSCQLPRDYREFLLSSNGAFPTPDCATFDEDGRTTASDVYCLFAIGDDRSSLSMEWHQETFSHRLPENTLPIGRDSGGNLWLLSLRDGSAGAIFFWDHGSYDTFDESDLDNWPKVASSFKEFLGNLRAYDTAVEAGGVPSRYSLVRQATAGMVARDSEFSTRGNPGFVWHCDCDDAGNVQMQFVQYEVHAVATHTCGYSRLRAIKGLTQGGRPRLPQ